ncbi:MAG TPA: carboxypeptidase-like regulatory domain-containing protein [Terracidiphilus sp.]|nr:carboxypeptidase-like regulatory domain-containing protein [Terracidiphilus sp.]
MKEVEAMNVWKFTDVILMTILLLTPSGICYAQTKPESPSISGVIVDDAESVPVTDAHIWIHEHSGRTYFETRPDNKGKFSVMLPDGYYYVLAGAAGFAPYCKSVWVQSGKPITISPRLKPDYENLQDARSK